MIDEKKLIKVLKKHFDADYGEDGRLLYSDHVCTSDDVEDIIKLVEEQPRVGEWIPCGKEKPRGGENIATVKWYDGTIEVVHAYYDGFDWITGCGERAEVIAWMPLPPAYKEGE